MQTSNGGAQPESTDERLKYYQATFGKFYQRIFNMTRHKRPKASTHTSKCSPGSKQKHQIPEPKSNANSNGTKPPRLVTLPSTSQGSPGLYNRLDLPAKHLQHTLEANLSRLVGEKLSKVETMWGNIKAKDRMELMAARMEDSDRLSWLWNTLDFEPDKFERRAKLVKELWYRQLWKYREDTERKQAKDNWCGHQVAEIAIGRMIVGIILLITTQEGRPCYENTSCLQNLHC